MRQESSGGLFVTGTDTGVGKTLVACCLVRALRGRGLDVGVLKPVETGVGEAGPEDALALREAAQTDEPLEAVCPIRLPLPAAPLAAARDAGVSIDRETIRGAWRRLRQRHPWRVVEGAGGLLVPVAAGWSMADLASEWELPVLVVARARLGTINHTLLTVEAVERRSLDLAGVVISHADGPTSLADQRNLDLLREALGERLVGEIPPLGADARRQAAGAQLDVDALLAAGSR